jgi:hypothetical protein
MQASPQPHGDAPAMGEASWTRPLRAPVVLGTYFLCFAVLGAPVLRVAATSLPELPNAYDSHLIAWILSWTTHSLTSDPSRLFDANIS